MIYYGGEMNLRINIEHYMNLWRMGEQGILLHKTGFPESIRKKYKELLKRMTDNYYSKLQEQEMDIYHHIKELLALRNKNNPIWIEKE